MYRRFLLLFVAMLLLGVPCGSGAGEARGGGAGMTEIAAGLDGSNFRESFVLMRPHAPESARALIGELRVVDVNHIPGFLQDQNPDGMHVIWCLRMLRALTGRDFTAKTKHEFNPDEREAEYWLKMSDAENIPFFRTMESGDSVFIAPDDVQEAVIGKWKKWYEEEGAAYEYKTQPPPFDDWYY